MRLFERWRGKTALVTGASAGIGTELARHLARAGCHLVLTARRRERLEALGEELSEAHGVEVAVVAADLGQPDGARELFEEVTALDRPVDLLINNAGFGISGLFADNDWDRERSMIQLNVLALVELTKLHLPAMLERRSGDILLVSSIGGLIPAPAFAVYTATKAFVTHFGCALGHELRGTGVTCTVLNPGGTATEFLDVAGMKPTRVSRMGMMSAEAVARVGLVALARGKRSVVAGFMNAVMMWLATRLLPLGLRLRAAGLFQKLAGGH